MTGNEAVLHAVSALDDCGIPYMLVGSYSTNVYGIPMGKRCQVPLFGFMGRPMVETSTLAPVAKPFAFARFLCRMVDLCGCCAGWPLFRRVIGMLTRNVQSGGLSIGQRDSFGSASASLMCYRAKSPIANVVAPPVLPAPCFAARNGRWSENDRRIARGRI